MLLVNAAHRIRLVPAGNSAERKLSQPLSVIEREGASSSAESCDCCSHDDDDDELDSDLQYISRCIHDEQAHDISFMCMNDKSQSSDGATAYLEIAVALLRLKYKCSLHLSQLSLISGKLR